MSGKSVPEYWIWSCPACDSNKVSVLKKIVDYPLRRCGSCGLEFIFPMPSEDELSRFYAHYSDHLASEPVVKMNALKNCADLMVHPDTKILDFGCGNNYFAQVIRQAQGEDRFSHPGLSIGGKFDLITLWGVLEHLTDPFDELCGLYQRLEQHGRLALTTVSIETPIPYRHKPPEHTLYFTRAAIAALADRCGFRVIEYRPYRMIQDSDVYLDTLLRTMPDEYQALVTHSMPKYVEIPTNEVFVVMEKV